MAQINLNDIQPGMVLASSVFNKNGGLLLKEGSTLTEKHIRIFKTWGVTEADIVGYDKEKVEEEAYSFLSEEEIQDIESAIFKRFPDFSSDSVMSEIFRIAKKQIIHDCINKGPAVL